LWLCEAVPVLLSVKLATARSVEEVGKGEAYLERTKLDEVAEEAISEFSDENSTSVLAAIAIELITDGRSLLE